jgi:AcrR family transcriptional regulator
MPTPDEHAAPRPSREDLVERATAHFRAGRRIEMRALAEEVGVGRSTLYRWVGDREQLLGEILWALARTALDRAEDATRDRPPGADRVTAVAEAFMRQLHGFAPLRAFLTAEPEFAMRVLMTARGGVQQRTVMAFADLIRAERLRAPLGAGVDERVLAYAVVRLGESFLYADAIADAEPGVDDAVTVIRALLRD